VVGRENVIAGKIVASAAGHHDRPPGDLDDAVGPQPRPRTRRNQARRELGARGISRANANASSSRSMISAGGALKPIPEVSAESVGFRIRHFQSPHPKRTSAQDGRLASLLQP
jgi:hypothetical protein